MSNEYELRIVNKPSFYIELISLLNRLINDKDFKNIHLSNEEGKFLSVLEDLRLKGFELFEFYLYDHMADYNAIERVFRGYEKAALLYLLCGEVLTREEIGRVVLNFQDINLIVGDKPYLEDYDWLKLKYPFEKTEEFVNKLLQLLKALSPEALRIIENNELYEASLQKTSKELKQRVPLEVAQSIMGKRFKRVFDFKTYYFIPSYFYMSKPMRTFNESTQLVIYPVEDSTIYTKAALANALRIIGDNTRLEIIERLSKQPMFGKELAKELKLRGSTVSHHLEQLRSIGLINEERDKNTKYFSLNIVAYNKLCDALRSFIEKNDN